MMDMQMAPPPYTAAGNPAPPTGNPPVLGQQIPGMTGGLPSQGGLPVTANPMAEQLQSQGRDEDTMLVHMTPDEVNSLQGLAMAAGGSLTINPYTGLPEAGFLKKLLPTLLGVGLNFIPGIGPLAAAGLVAAGSVAKTGSLKKGLMAGLQAYGGASLAGGLAPAATGTKIASAAGGAGAGGFGSSANMARGLAADSMLANTATTAGTTAAKTGLAGIAQGFGTAAKAGLPSGVIANAAPKVAAMGLMQGVTGAMTPSGGRGVGPSGQIDNSFQGPYYAQERKASFAPTNEELLSSTKERRYFNVDMPEIYNTMGQVVQPGSHTVRGTQIMQPVLNPKAKKGQNMYDFRPVTYMGGIDPNEEEGVGYSAGGELQIADGGFIVDARSTAEAGNGLNQAGQERFKALGGIPINGPGDGVSDSIPARIGRNQPARVAAGEVYMPPEAVRRIGKGSPQRGANKLYAMMNEAHKATKRGQKRDILKGLA